MNEAFLMPPDQGPPLARANILPDHRPVVGFQGGRAWGQLGDEGRAGAAGTPGKEGRQASSLKARQSMEAVLQVRGKEQSTEGIKKWFSARGENDSGERRVGHGSGPGERGGGKEVGMKSGPGVVGQGQR